MATDNTLLNAGTGGDTVRSLARAAGIPKTSIVQLDLGGATANAEVLITAGQQTMAVSVPVVIASNQTAIPVIQSDVTATGTLTAAAQTVALTLSGQGAASAQVTGTWVGTLTFEASLDGTTWTAINAVSASTSSPQTTTTVNGLYRLTPAGTQQFRVNMTAFTSGSAAVSLRASAGTGGIFANQILPAKITDGTNTATIKAASTAAAAADPAIVVAISPNNAVSAATTTAAPTYTTGTNNPLSTTVNGALRTQIDNSPTVFLAAGSAIVGKVGIDQTTPGTTNLVALTAETTKVIGTVNLSAGQTLAVSNNGVISTVNSTAVALGIGGVFTGTSEDITEYADIRVSVFADQASATDGLQMQQSSNGTNWDIPDSYSIPASSGKVFSVGASAKFFRIVYTNGAVASTVFRLQVKYHKAYAKSSSVRPQDARTNDNDYEEMLSHLMGYNGTTWDRLRSTIANGLAVDVTRSALPTGASTETTLAALNTKVTAVNTGAVVLAAGTAVVGALTANQSVNTAQINGVAPLMGNGVTGTGSQRVTIASDNTPHAVKIDQTTPQSTNQVTIQPSTLAVTVTAAANTAATLTIPAVAGQFHYITGLEIMRTATAALAGTATLVVTTTNLPGSLAWSFGNAMAAGGTQKDETLAFDNPLKSSVVNTATTVVMPAPGAAVLWRANVYYYTAA